MRIEIRASGGPTCTCGATELIYVPATNAHLEHDLLAAIDEKVPRWRWVKRKYQKRLVSKVGEAAASLREQTRF